MCGYEVTLNKKELGLYAHRGAERLSVTRLVAAELSDEAIGPDLPIFNPYSIPGFVCYNFSSCRPERF